MEAVLSAAQRLADVFVGTLEASNVAGALGLFEGDSGKPSYRIASPRSRKLARSLPVLLDKRCHKSD
jgi:hypothetical protein